MKKILPFLTIFCLPVLALAQTAKTILADIRDILNVAIPVLMVLGVVYFIWGVIEFMTAKDEEKRKEGRSKMIWGIVGLFVIIAVWALVDVIAGSFNIGTGGGPSGIPGV